MTTITPGGLTADRVAVEARPEVEDRFLLVALANVAFGIVLTALAIAYDLPATLGVAADRATVSDDALRVGTALSVPVPLIVLFAMATMVALQGGVGRKVAALACAAYGVLGVAFLLGGALTATPLDGTTEITTTVLQLAGAAASAGLAFSAVQAVRHG
jgi:hypothetical protein